MSAIDGETKRKLREMGATALLELIEAQDDTLVMGCVSRSGSGWWLMRRTRCSTMPRSRA